MDTSTLPSVAVIARACLAVNSLRRRVEPLSHDAARIRATFGRSEAADLAVLLMEATDTLHARPDYIAGVGWSVKVRRFAGVQL